MLVRQIELVNFRSYEQAKFELHPDLTLVVGPNASGKTNLLEALYVLALTRSFRAKDVDLVRHGTGFYRVAVSASDNNELAIGYKSTNGVTEKRVTHGRTRKTLAAHIGKLPVVLFEPNDLWLLSGPPDQRRKYLDILLSQTDPQYLAALTDYRHVLKQRNRLLDDEWLARQQVFAWDMQLSQAAAVIYRARLALIDYINSVITDVYRSIAGAPVELELAYKPTIEATDYAAEFPKALADNLNRDLAAGFTTIGPHREDFAVHFKDRSLGGVASRGEVRSVVLGLKLTEVKYLEQKREAKPILLLDDVFSELDSDRRGLLIKLLAGYQTVITTTDADAVTSSLPPDYLVIKTAETKRA